MKILLMSPSIEDEQRSTESHDTHYPLGLIYLQAYAAQNGFDEIDVHHGNDNPLEDTFDFLESYMEEHNPALVGLSIMTHSRVSAYECIEFLTDNYPDTQIVLGGIHSTVMYKQLISEFNNVIVVIGEGEITFTELLKKLESNEPFEDVAGIAYHDEVMGTMVTTKSRDLIADLDVLPIPRHDNFLHHGKTLANLLTSRGCPFKCSFCVLDSLSRRKVRFRSASNIVDEVEAILSEYPSVNTIWIHDDAFMINQQRTLDFCAEVIKRGVKTSFVCSARFNPVSEEVLSAMEAAGFSHVLFGLESGATSVMKKMHKGIKKEHVRKTFNILKTMNIKATAFLIVGLIGETQETIQETIDFIQEIQGINYTYYDDMGIAGIYPGTELYDVALAEGFMTPEYWLTDKPVPWYEIENSYEQMLVWKSEIQESISLNRIWTMEGFLKQRKLIPSIIGYSMKFGLPRFSKFVVDTVSKRGLWASLLGGAFRNHTGPIKHKITAAIEQEIFNILSKQANTGEKGDMLKQYKDQVRQDNILFRKKTGTDNV